MAKKPIADDLLQRIPDSVSLLNNAREVEFIAAVRLGLEELDCGGAIPIEEVERELVSWIRN